MEIPSTFNKAAKIIYASLGVGVVKSVLYGILTDTSILDDFNVLIATILILAFIFLLGHQIGEAKNWARITFSIMVVLGTLYIPNLIIQELNSVPILGILTIIQTGLQLYAVYILFSGDCKEWFKNRKKRA
jgi:uncharacterized membrane protein